MLPPLVPSCTDQVTVVTEALATVAVNCLVVKTVMEAVRGVRFTVVAGVVGVEEVDDPPPPPQACRERSKETAISKENAGR
jgi:hypothetical protein